MYSHVLSNSRVIADEEVEKTEEPEGKQKPRNLPPFRLQLKKRAFRQIRVIS